MKRNCQTCKYEKVSCEPLGKPFCSSDTDWHKWKPKEFKHRRFGW